MILAIKFIKTALIDYVNTKITNHYAAYKINNIKFLSNY